METSGYVQVIDPNNPNQYKVESTTTWASSGSDSPNTDWVPLCQKCGWGHYGDCSSPVQIIEWKPASGIDSTVGDISYCEKCSLIYVGRCPIHSKIICPHCGKEIERN